MPYHGFGHPPFGAPPSPEHAVFAAFFMMLPWLVLAALGAWQLFRLYTSRPETWAIGASEAPSAVELLSRRYVRGEIDVMAFEEMLERILGAEQRERVRLAEPLPSPTIDHGHAQEHGAQTRRLAPDLLG